MFDQFYSLYPRKEGKKDAYKAWGQITPEQQQKAIETIQAHVDRWKALGTEKHYIPLPASWLRGWRFDDEIELPKPKTVDNWWSSETGIMAKAKELGMSIRPGESWFELKNRINESIKKASNG